MRTISIIIYCLVTVAAALLPLTQGSRSPRFMKFYRRMAEKAWARKAFTLGLAVTALAWNFACFISYGTSPWPPRGCCPGWSCPSPCCPTG